MDMAEGVCLLGVAHEIDAFFGEVGAGAGLDDRHHSAGLCVASFRHRQHRRPAGGEARRRQGAALHLRTQPRHLLHVVDLLRLGRTCERTRYRVPGDLFRPRAGVPVRLASPAQDDPAFEGRAHHLHRRFPRRTLRQELRRRLDRDADRHRRHGSLHRAAAQGDFRLCQPDGGTLQRPRAVGRSGVRRRLARRGAASGAFRHPVRNPPCRRDRASGRADPRHRRRIGDQAGGVPEPRPGGDIHFLRRSRRADRDGAAGCARPGGDGLSDLARDLGRADAAQRIRDHHAAAAVLRDDRGKPRRERVAHRDMAVSALPRADQHVRPADRLRGHAVGRHADDRGPLRALGTDDGRPRLSRLLRLHRWIFGGDGHGHRRQRRAVDHDLQRSGDPDLPQKAAQAGQGRKGRLVEPHPQHPPRGDLRRRVRRLLLLPRDDVEYAAGGNRADLIRRDRPVRTGAGGWPCLARRQCARRDPGNDRRHAGVGLHAAVAVARAG